MQIGGTIIVLSWQDALLVWGAYTGIGTGAAGLYYNPGGMGFSPDLQLSVSTTNYYTSTIKQQGYLRIAARGLNLGMQTY